MLDFVRRRTKSEHERVTAMLSAYIDGELRAKEQRQVEAHLAHCEACAEELRVLQYTKALLAEAPMPRIPRSFVVRRADLEAPADAAPRRAFGLGPRLSYGYLKGATALVTVAFALVVAGDLIAQPGFGGAQLASAPAREATVVETVEVEKEMVVQATEGVQESYEETQALAVEGAPEEEVQVEKVVLPAATPAPSVERLVVPTASPPAQEKEQESIRSLDVPKEAATQTVAAEDLPVEAVAVEETYGADETPMPTPMPAATPPPSHLPSTTLIPSPSPLPFPIPTSPPPVTPEPTATTVVAERRGYPGILRITEIGLGTLALILLVATLLVRRQQSY